MIQIVIDIPEGAYEEICRAKFPIQDGYRLVSWIKDGTPLPKGHGRLIDADAFIATLENTSKRQKYKELLIDDLLTVDDVFKAIIESLRNEGLAEGDTPTIIEADNVESEEQQE